MANLGGRNDRIRSQSNQSTQHNDHYRSDSVSSGHRSLAAPFPYPPQRHDPHPLQRPSTSPTISIAVDPVALITTECITVTSAMRKHSRWAQSSVSAILGGGTSGQEVGRAPKSNEKELSLGQQQGPSGKALNGLARVDDTLANRWGIRGKKGRSIRDNPLMSAFARLRHDLRGCTGQNIFDSCCLFKG